MAEIDNTTIKGIQKRGNYYWFRLQVNKRSIAKSLKCSDLETAVARAAVIKKQFMDGICDIGPEYNSKNNNKDWIKKLISSARKRASERNIEFDIDYDYLSNLAKRCNMCCEITGISFNWNKADGCRVGPYVPSLDRIDNKKGYIKGNVRLVCWAVNIGLSDWGKGVYLEICKAVVGRHLLNIN